MPQKNTATRPSGRTQKNKKQGKQSPWSRFLATRYGQPAVYVLLFAILGTGVSFLVNAATTTYSLWSNSTIPKVIAVSDSSSAELGVKFQAKVAGYVTGVRFYKGAQNIGTHTGNLWDSSGKLLASVKFTNETASGWQSATFAQPVSIAANATYVVSYHAPSGHYSLNANYFKTGSHDRKYLTAPQNTTTSPNGVFIASSSDSTFPTQSGNGANYWVDLIFTNKLINPQPAPAAPTNLSANVAQDGKSVTLNWTASISASPITQYTVYRDGSKVATVGTALTYTDNSVTGGDTYTYQVQATDDTGASSALSTSISATIPSSTGSGSGGGTAGSSTCPLPAYPTPTCTGTPASTTLSKTISGDYEAKSAGEVIDGWHITGNLTVEAANVTIKNSQIDGTVDNEVGTTHYGPFTISDTTVGPASGCISAPGIGESDYTAQRVRIRGHDDGFRMSGNNVNVSDSYAHLCWNPPSIAPPDGSHSDGLQNYCPNGACVNLVFNHNTIDEHDIAGNSGANLGSSADGSQFGNVVLNDNLFWGGGYVLALEWRNVSSSPSSKSTACTGFAPTFDAAKTTITNNGTQPDCIWQVHNNRIVQKSQSGWEYGPIDAEGTCANQDWQGNTIVAIDTNYNVTGTVSQQACIN